MYVEGWLCFSALGNWPSVGASCVYLYVCGRLCLSALEKWPSIGDSCVSQPYTPLLSPCGQGPAGPRGGSDLCLRTQFHQLCDCIFLAFLVSALPAFDSGLEASAGFLVGGAGACLLVGGIGSWPSGGQDHI